MRVSLLLLTATLGWFGLGCTPSDPPVSTDTAALRWWKGNLHTHSFWSDGDDYPEMVIGWYKDHGYDFIALSDHNTLAEGERWINPAERGGQATLDAYRDRFGADWVTTREQEDHLEVRLKTLAQYRPLFEEPGAFLIIQSEEISDGFEGKPIHVNATNIATQIEPQGGTSVQDVMQNNVDAVLEQRAETGQPMFPHINHPNFGWAITAEDLIGLEGERFFEVYNGHPAVRNEGDDRRPGTERMWDIVLTQRRVQERPFLFGLAVDDAHNYHTYDQDHSNPGRAWVMVQAPALTPAALIAAMEAGNFYATTGVLLDSMTAANGALALQIQAEPGVTYTTRFIGTRRGFDRRTEPVTVGGAPVTHRYSDDIGMVLAEVTGPAPSYRLAGDELYVRATVISSKPKSNPYRPGETETAWTQPILPPGP